MPSPSETVSPGVDTLSAHGQIGEGSTGSADDVAIRRSSSSRSLQAASPFTRVQATCSGFHGMDTIVVRDNIRLTYQSDDYIGDDAVLDRRIFAQNIAG